MSVATSHARWQASIALTPPTSTASLLASGLRFTSRLPPAWECWALWEPPPLDEAGAQIEDVTFDTPAPHTAADMLGVALAQ